MNPDSILSSPQKSSSYFKMEASELYEILEKDIKDNRLTIEERESIERLLVTKHKMPLLDLWAKEKIKIKNSESSHFWTLLRGPYKRLAKPNRENIKFTYCYKDIGFLNMIFRIGRKLGILAILGFLFFMFSGFWFIADASWWTLALAVITGFSIIRILLGSLFRMIFFKGVVLTIDSLYIRNSLDHYIYQVKISEIDKIVYSGQKEIEYYKSEKRGENHKEAIGLINKDKKCLMLHYDDSLSGGSDLLIGETLIKLLKIINPGINVKFDQYSSI